MAEIACLGILVADTVGKPIDTLPRRGTLELIDRIELHSGGNAANTAVSLARIGVKAAIVGKVGADGFGDFMTAAMEKNGVDVRGLVRAPDSPTSATMVLVHSDAERTFLHVIGANATFSHADVDWDAIEGAKILHVAGLQLMPAFEGEGIARVLREAKRRGMITTLDTVMNPRSAWWSGMEACLPYLDWALPSYEEAVRLTGETDNAIIAATLKDNGVKNVAIKLGQDGCFVSPEKEKNFTVRPLTVKAIDSLGAGDAWSAGFVTGLFYEWPLEKTVRFANAVGACCVQALGATTGVRSLKETLAMIGEV